MILQALKQYYDRKAADPDSGIASEGFEKKEIPFIVVIKPDGRFLNLEDTREKVGQRMIGKLFLLPRSKQRSGKKSFETTFLLWDHIGYLFGYPETEEKSSNQHASWLKSFEELPEGLKQDVGVKAMILFYQTGEMAKVKEHPVWSECVRPPSCNMAFRLEGDVFPIPCRSAVQEYVNSTVSSTAEPDEETKNITKVFGNCLISGEHGEIARTHARTPIDKDTKMLVAFQKNSGYDSYGKEQCYNAPVSIASEFAYTTGLNNLLKSKSQRIQVGDATSVFWSARESSFEKEAVFFFSEPPKDDPNRNTEAIKALYDSIWRGDYCISNDDTRFYVLGLAPNSARIAVRFWNVGTVREMGTRFKQHVDDLAISHDEKINPALPIQRLLRSIAVLKKDDKKKDEKIPPNIVGETMRAILSGTPYPFTLLQAAVRRTRSEQSRKNKQSGKPEPNVPYERAALIKACLNRALRFNNPNNERMLTMSLDSENMNIGYRLGRLFATLEKVQEEAGKGINSTIRDRFYGSASGSPVTVFGTLTRLNKHHLSKLESVGRRIYFEKLLGEIVSGFDEFPAHLNIADQGRFAIGYYHQRQLFFTHK